MNQVIKGKKILLGICGGIAAYKAASLVRLLIKGGAEVKVIMTPNAHDFVTPLTLSTLSKNPVLTKFKKDETGEWNHHVSLGLWADLFIIAPLTANTLAKMVNGLCDNLLLATYLSCRGEILVAPAMDLDMYTHFSTEKNLRTLSDNKVNIIEPNTGELASGLIGKGRMAEPEEVIQKANDILDHHKNTISSPLTNKKVLLTMGPTYEFIDPVRYITNGSSGKMGTYISEELNKRGAIIEVISGPINTYPQGDNISIHKINTAVEMFEQSSVLHNSVDIAIFAAAVADYRPINTASEKIKKNDPTMVIELTKNPDIAKELGSQKQNHQIHVGFALETQNEIENAIGKLNKKNLDFVVLNSLRDQGAGFGYDTNKVTFVEKNNHTEFNLKSKKEVAIDICDFIETKILNLL